jgi:hypothetical protein
MLSSRAPSNHGTHLFTCTKRANMPSVPSTTMAARPSHRARMVSPSMTATTVRKASTTPDAV